MAVPIRVSPIGQCIFTLTSPEASFSRSARKNRVRIRLALLRNRRFRRLPVRYRIHGIDLLMPLEHLLRDYRSNFPDYCENLGRIARRVCRKYPTAPVIDIGANIGDSVAIIRHYAGPVATLCIEPSDEFYPYLRQNAEAIGPHITCLKAAVDVSSGAIRGRLSAIDGTARLLINSSESVSVFSLERVVQMYPQFAETKLIKIDTDGFDGRILAGASAFIQRVRPVLFWEFDPSLDAACAGPGPAIFAMLADAGYRHLAVYTNTGDYLTTLSLKDRDLLSDLISFFSGRMSSQYADLCAFPEVDADLAEALREEELLNAQQLRGFVSPTLSETPLGAGPQQKPQLSPSLGGTEIEL
jgi:FkbM family methyltransferase